MQSPAILAFASRAIALLLLPLLLGAYVPGIAVAQARKTYLIFVQIPEGIKPIERGEKYEDPIDAAMGKLGLGSVSGGGSQLGENSKIVWVGVDVDVYDIDESLPHLKRILKELGAPMGTKLSYRRDGMAVEVPLFEQK